MQKKIGKEDISLNANWDVFEFYGDSNVAILYSNIRFWIKHNEKNKKHFYGEKYWTYNTVEAFQELFPMWSYKQIRLMLQKLEDDKFLVIGNFNEKKYDKTKWYSLGKLK